MKKDCRAWKRVSKKKSMKEICREINLKEFQQSILTEDIRIIIAASIPRVHQISLDKCTQLLRDPEKMKN